MLNQACWTGPLQFLATLIHGNFSIAVFHKQVNYNITTRWFLRPGMQPSSLYKIVSNDAVHSTTQYTRLFNHFNSYSVILLLVSIILPYKSYFGIVFVIVVLVKAEY